MNFKTFKTITYLPPGVYSNIVHMEKSKGELFYFDWYDGELIQHFSTVKNRYHLYMEKIRNLLYLLQNMDIDKYKDI